MATRRPSAQNSPLGYAEVWIARAASLSAEDLRRARTWLTAAGVLALVTGLIAVFVPVIASVTIAIFIGWVLVAAGIVMAAHAFSSGTRGRVTLRLLEAVLTFLVGLYVLIFPLHGTVTLTFVLAVWFFATGLMQLVAAMAARGIPGWGMIALSGTLSVVLGLLIALDLPSSGAWAIGLLVGINLIFWGIRALFGAQLLKEFEHGSEPAGGVPRAGAGGAQSVPVH
jgi:uncharacterized membrane protein HdeD (DUF308 family)